jgi:sulfide:quinone oxidoreductase
MLNPPMRVVIAGGGSAALEALMALRSLAGHRVELALVAPDGDFVYSPSSAQGQFSVGRTRRVPRREAARDADAVFFAATVEAVDTDAHTINTSGGERLEYDALVLALGAKATTVVPRAITWDDRSDAQMIGGLLADIDEGYSQSVAVVIPPGPTWPLRAYELALLIAREANGMSVGVDTTIVSPDPSPLEILGSRLAEAISKQLDAAGIDVLSADHVDVEPGHATALVLEPSGRRLEVDRVVALPALEGRQVAGIPADAKGFIDVDDHCRVRGVNGVWAVGDGTAFPLKSAGVAAEQADVAAEDIAASAGATVEPRWFDSVDRGKLAGLPFGAYLTMWLGDGDARETTDIRSLGMQPLTYLERDLAAGWRGHA